VACRIVTSTSCLFAQLESVDYWFASRHLEELNLAREADSVLPSDMELGGWRGTQHGTTMLFEHGGVLLSQLDDSFTSPRQLVLTEDGFIYMGLAGVAVAVQYDDKGQLKPLPGVDAEPQHGGACLLYDNAELREKILPQLLGVKASVIQKFYDCYTETMKKMAVKQRAENPAARAIAPHNWSRRKEGWIWIGKGSGNMQEGAVPFGE
jgi:hypothetical protein